jgi:hypothetical protein
VQKEPCGEWSFTGLIRMTYSVTYLKGKNAKAADGNTYEQHEWLHIDDFQRWCASMHKNYRSEGFPGEPECNSARTYFMNDARPLFNMADTATKANRD